MLDFFKALSEVPVSKFGRVLAPTMHSVCVEACDSLFGTGLIEFTTGAHHPAVQDFVTRTDHLTRALYSRYRHESQKNTLRNRVTPHIQNLKKISNDLMRIGISGFNETLKWLDQFDMNTPPSEHSSSPKENVPQRSGQSSPRKAASTSPKKNQASMLSQLQQPMMTGSQPPVAQYYPVIQEPGSDIVITSPYF